MPDLRGGGAERVAMTLVNRLVSRDHEVDLLVMEKSGELLELVAPSVRVIDLKASRIRNIVRPLSAYLARVRPDAVQVSMWPLTIAAIMAKILSRSAARLVVSDHAILSDHYPRARHRLIGASIRFLYPMADARVAVSQGAADDISRISGLDPRSIDVIYNPIDLPPTRMSSKKHVGGPNILSIGSLNANKNHELLIRSFAALSADLDARLVIAGDGALKDQLIALAAREGVGDRVRFPGFVADVWPFYAAADLFVMTSREESFGNVLVEALHAGLPIVSTSTIGSREILEGGHWGRLVHQADPATIARAIVEEFGKTPDRARLRRRAFDLSGEHAVEAYTSVLLGGAA